MFTLFWFTFLIFSVSCYGRLFLQLHQCLYIINIHLLYQYWCHDLFFKYLRVHFIQWNHSFVSLINSIVLESGLGSNCFLQILDSIHVTYTGLMEPSSSDLMCWFFTRNTKIVFSSPLSFILFFSIFVLLFQFLDFPSFRFTKILFSFILINTVCLLTAARFIFHIFIIFFVWKFTCFLTAPLPLLNSFYWICGSGTVLSNTNQVRTQFYYILKILQLSTYRTSLISSKGN